MFRGVLKKAKNISANGFFRVVDGCSDGVEISDKQYISFNKHHL